MPETDTTTSQTGPIGGFAPLPIHHGVEDPVAPARKAHPGLLVAGLSHLARRLHQAGCPVTWDGEFPGHDRFYSTDPFGNHLEFLQPQSAPAPPSRQPISH